ncbi:DUF6994 family protein [Pedococcus sp. NPDC057267]|uniref:DUF6994 family protein n=1 Tax=Pedococcus sp. NPDC057267 TaxID=3346077 RepID=UPI0036303BAE
MTRDGAHHAIDITFNFELDARGGDPDQTSPTLRRYHQLLWSKPLPDGSEFTLDATTRHSYLHHASALGEFFLSSDSIVHSYRGAYGNRVGALMAQVPPGHAAQLHDQGSTIGGYILFPGDVRDRKPTINGARGMNAKICDRIDLTLECIRRHYAGGDSPLAETLGRYQDFFALFGDFHHYVAFFLLEDLLETNSDEIRWYLPFDDFKRSPLPLTLREYESYRQAALRFVRGPNRRIDEWATANLSSPVPDRALPTPMGSTRTQA